MQRYRLGTTLLELIVTISIISIVIGVAIPSLQRTLERNQGKQAIIALHLLLYNTREQAVNLQEIITLCPDSGSFSCSSDWNNKLIMFIDKNQNKALDSDETLLYEHPPSKQNEVRTFSGGQIRFDSHGFAGIATGSLGYCSGISNPTSASFILSRTGRIRRGEDSNKDGIVELASGQNVSCPN